MSSSDSEDSGTDPYYSEMARYRKLEIRRLAVADGDWGIPKKCPCGERITTEISVTETEKKKYLTCVKYEDDGLHRRKDRVDAIEEEILSLRGTVDKHIERLRDFATHEVQIHHLNTQIQVKDEEIAKLKEQVESFENRIRILEHCCFD